MEICRLVGKDKQRCIGGLTRLFASYNLRATRDDYLRTVV